MRCPFNYRRRKRFSFGVASEFVHFVMEREDAEEAAYNAAYPTCWHKFLLWLGINRPAPAQEGK